MLDLSDLSDGAKKRCIDGLDIIVTKLLSVWSLRDSYAKLEKQLEEDARNNPVAYGGKAESAGWHDLYQYFELFSVQIKSVLDHMVYFLRHGVDQSVFGFNEKGQVIVNILENNIPKSASSVVKKKISAIIVKLIRDNNSWLKDTIDVRDDFNHYTDGRFHPNQFVVIGIKHPDGKVTVQLPEVDGVRVLERMRLDANNIMVFVECFVGVCLAPQVTKLGIAIHWSGRVDEAIFSFGPWEQLDNLIAIGALKAEGVLNQRKVQHLDKRGGIARGLGCNAR
jgi:hypothetical protein